MQESTDIIRLYKTYDEFVANLVKAQLEGEGIPCILKRDDAGGMLPHLTALNGIEIMVLQEDKQKASEVLRKVGNE